MVPIIKLFAGCVLLVVAFLFFLMEYKAFPYRPKHPEKWDAFHAKYFRTIRMVGRMSLLLGLTFLFYAFR